MASAKDLYIKVVKHRMDLEYLEYYLRQKIYEDPRDIDTRIRLRGITDELKELHRLEANLTEIL